MWEKGEEERLPGLIIAKAEEEITRSVRVTVNMKMGQKRVGDRAGVTTNLVKDENKEQGILLREGTRKDTISATK